MEDAWNVQDLATFSWELGTYWRYATDVVYSLNYNHLYSILVHISSDVICFHVQNSCNSSHKESKNVIIYKKWIFLEAQSCITNH